MEMHNLYAAALGIILAGGTVASAADLDTYVSSPAFPSDTRTFGLASDSTALDPVGTGWVHLQTFAGTGSEQKVAPFFSTTTFNAAAPASIGTLGTLSTYTADWYRESGGMQIPAFRMLIGVGTGPQGTNTGYAEFIWEPAYQVAIPSFSAGTTYDDVNLNGRFYVRGNFNFDAIGTTNYGEATTGSYHPATIAEWTSGVQLSTTDPFPLLSPNTEVYGVQTAIGSGAGVYSGFVRDVNVTFVPEPTTLTLIGLCGLAALRRRRGL